MNRNDHQKKLEVDKVELSKEKSADFKELAHAVDRKTASAGE
jgi:hypothetical protein